MRQKWKFLEKPESYPQPLPAEPINDSSANPWTPFEDRLEFDWAYYHYVRLQSSASNISEGLELWRATVVKHSSVHPTAEDVPWRNVDELLVTHHGRAINFRTVDQSHRLHLWMEETYELNAQDVLVVPEQQLDTPDIKGQMQNIPYQEFNKEGDRVCSNLMSGDWASKQAKYKVVKCSDGHFRRATFGLGPYIADYPEQVWLAGNVYGWCPKCDARPENLDGPGSDRRSHEKTDLLINSFDPGILWDDFGIRNDIVPFTHGFPRADIHELLAPDLLRQLIKVPPYPGLRRFPDGQDYRQWTGDDSKALMKVYLAAIAGYLPSSMVQCIATFMDACYIARRNAITGPALEHFQSKHIKAVKELWRRSSRHHALIQRLRTLVRMDKIAALHRLFTKRGMLAGTISSYMMRMKAEDILDEAENPAGCDGPEDDAEDDGRRHQGARSYTGMWTVQLEHDRRGLPTVEVIDIDTVARGAHLLPVYGSSRVPEDFSHHDALNNYNSFFLNYFVDHNAHEFITMS
ncbi:hypothetical protein GALMADRAFT_214468 [Galerina marginata CBS 339.88]|uniref:Uncharacterized protein n=1 Tax=Galerina marginata (strain CBS 339.88) TaxID=685588 RepID=A0A067SL49_GALM3|nr:hypothetical protein GALMADRAFT_214468 [Galerina marginata CBS 339.88]